MGFFKSTVVGAFAAAALALSGGVASAATLTFDDVDLGGAGYAALSPAYAGFTWTNWAIINGPVYGESGYANGVVSGDQVACGCAGDFSQTVNTISSATAFTFVSGYFTSAWNDGATLDVRGYLGATQTNSAAFTLDTTGPSFLTFGWNGIDRLEFEISGGTQSGYPGLGDYFGADDLTFDTAAVPEPASWALMIGGFGLAGAALRRRRLVAAVA